MTKYVAFLRAINVGGHAIIKMTDLKQLFESLGMENVQTYIQSGNVIFESDEENAASMEKLIEDQVVTPFAVNVGIDATPGRSGLGAVGSRLRSYCR